MTAVDCAIGALFAIALWFLIFGFAAHKTRKTTERRELKRSAERAEGER